MVFVMVDVGKPWMYIFIHNRILDTNLKNS
jgi:hypothetical protein